MQLNTLVENLVYREGFRGEHGLSFYLKSDEVNVLFDVGQTDAFYHNAQLMELPIEEVDYLVLSHGHYDHTGGLSKFLEVNSKAKIVVHPDIFIPKYSGQRYIGIPQKSIIPKDRLILITDIFKISTNISVVPNTKIFFEEDHHNKRLSKQLNNESKADDFSDEIFLLLSNNNTNTLVSSCSHRGITNMIETVSRQYNVSVSNIVGGFHIKNSSEAVKKQIVQYFNDKTIKQVGICHCTGIENLIYLKQNLNAEVFYNHTGLRTEC